MNGLERKEGQESTDVSESDEGDTWAPLPPEPEGGDCSADTQQAETPKNSMNWEHLLEESSIASSGDKIMPGVSLSARVLSVRSRYEMAMAVSSPELLPQPPEQFNHSVPDLRRMASRSEHEHEHEQNGSKSPLPVASKSASAESPVESEDDDDEELGGFHGPESASVTATRSSHSADEDEDEGVDEDSRRQRSSRPPGLTPLGAAANFRNRRGSNASIAESIRSRKLRPFSIGRTASKGSAGFSRGPSAGLGSPPPIDEHASLLDICRRGHHAASSVKRAEELLRDDKAAAKMRDASHKMPVHLLCEAPGHTKYSVELLTLILKANKSGAKQTVANRRGGLLPIHILCANSRVTEYSEAVLRVLLNANEDGVEKRGSEEGEGLLPISMLVRNRRMNEGTFMMLKRLVEAHKESVKEKDAQGRTLLHTLCFSSKESPHTECSVRALQVVLDVYKRGPEVPDKKGLRPLHVLMLSEELTAHSVAICKMLLEKYEAVAQLPDDDGMLAVHHLCRSERLSDFSLEVLRKVLEAFEKGAQVKDSHGQVALHLICGAQKLSKVSVDMTRQLLLAHKQAYASQDRQGRLPLHVLMCSMTPERAGVEHGEEILDQLLWTDKAGVETPDQEGRVPLHELCAAGLFSESGLSMLDKLLSYGKETASVLDGAGDISLHLLCGSKPHTPFTTQGFERLFAVLRETKGQGGAEIAGHGAKLAIHCLCEAGSHTAESVEMFERLVAENAHGIGHKDAAGMTPLHWLCSAWGHTEHSETIFEELMETLQAKDAVLSEMKTKDGLLPVHILCGAGKHTAFSFRIFDRLVAAHREAALIQTQLSNVALNSFMPAVMSQRARGPDEVEENPEEVPDFNGNEDDGPAFPLGRVPLHFLCASNEHTEDSEKICQTLLDLHKDAVAVADEDGLLPLHLLCTSATLTSHSVGICKLVVEEFERQTLEADEESFLQPLLYVCRSSTLSEHSVRMCELLLESQSRQSSRRQIGSMGGGVLADSWLPLHDLCASAGHTHHSVAICRQLLVDHKDWACTPTPEKDVERGGGKLPLHTLCECAGHTEFSVEICGLLLETFADGIQVKASSSGCLPIHLLCANPALTPFSCSISQRLLSGAGGETAGTVCDLGLSPLHHLCQQALTSPSHVLLARQLLIKCPAACSMRAVDSVPESRDVNLPLHELCKAEHSAFSVEVCSFLVQVNPDAVTQTGNQIADETMMDEDDISGDTPLMMVVKGEKLNAHSAQMATMLVDEEELVDPLKKLAQKVYKPKGDETQQRMALRIMISLAFVEAERVISFFDLDESQNGAHSISFMKEVVDEVGFDADNPLHHVLRAGQLYKTLSEHETQSVLVARLSKLSDVHVEWAADIVEGLSGKVAKRAIWTPEKESDEFMVGDSPIGIAVELGDLKIVSHGAVFDVVKEAWPGEYKYQYNPFSGSIYNNLILEYSHSTATGSNHREFKWTWEKRFMELADPGLLNGSPMMMYWLGIFFQTTFLVVFHIVVENSAFPNSYAWSLGPASWYLILHVAGGILFEVGQMAGDGIVGYSQDPWNVVDVSMYSLLTLWLVFRVADAEEAAQAGGDGFIPETSISGEFLGLAAIFIWLRMLNVFGLDQNFGPLVRIMQGMVLNVFFFMVLLVVFLAGFATSIKSIFKRMDPDAPENAESEFPIDAFHDNTRAMISLLDMALGQFELISVFEINPLAFYVTLFFLLATFIMLFNLLIALMTDTYSTIRETSEQLWKKDRAMLMAAYTKTEKMSNRVNIGGVLTALPQPMNLLVIVWMLLITPVYLPFKLRNNPRGKGWQKLVNQLQKRIIDCLLFVIVCVPFCLVFVFLVLPLNWVSVASCGLLEYLGLELKSFPSILKTLLSQVLGIVFAPLIFAAALIYTPLHLLHRQLSKLCKGRYRDRDPDSTHGDLSIYRLPSEGSKEREAMKQKRGSLFGSLQAVAFRGSVVSESGGGTRLGSVGMPSGPGDQKSVLAPDPKQVSRVGSEKQWEQNLDEDDISALRAAHRATMPIDNTGEDDEADVVVNEEDQALQEVRNELGKKMATLDGNQRTLLQTTRDLQIESKAAQQETATSITKLESKVMDMGKENTSLAKTYEEKLAALQHDTEHKISRVAELLFYQAEAQQNAFKLQDQKINLLLQSMGYDEADTLSMSVPQTPLHPSQSFHQLFPGFTHTPSTDGRGLGAEEVMEHRMSSTEAAESPRHTPRRALEPGEKEGAEAPAPRERDGEGVRGGEGKGKGAEAGKEVPAGKEEAAGKEEVPAGKEEVLAGKEEVLAGKEEVLAGKEEVLAGKEEVPAGKEEVLAGKEEVLAGKEEVPAGKEEVPAGAGPRAGAGAGGVAARVQVAEGTAAPDSPVDAVAHPTPTVFSPQTLLQPRAAPASGSAPPAAPELLMASAVALAGAAGDRGRGGGGGAAPREASGAAPAGQGSEAAGGEAAPSDVAVALAGKASDGTAGAALPTDAAAALSRGNASEAPGGEAALGGEGASGGEAAPGGEGASGGEAAASDAVQGNAPAEKAEPAGVGVEPQLRLEAPQAAAPATPTTARDGMLAAAGAGAGAGSQKLMSAMDRVFGKLRGQGSKAEQTGKRTLPKMAKKPAMQALEENMTQGHLESKRQMEELSGQISSLAPSLGLLREVLEAQGSSAAQVQRLQERLATMEPALSKLDARLDKAEQAAAASSGELKGSLASLNPQIRALETHLASKQQESSAQIMKAVEERVAAVQAGSELGTQELLRAWEQKAEAIQRGTAQGTAAVQRAMEERMQGLAEQVEQRNEVLMKEVEGRVERAVGQSSAAVERKMAEQAAHMEWQVAQVADQQRADVREQVRVLDERMVEEITRMDARVKAEVHEMSLKSTERMETQMGTVIESLEAKIAETYDQLKGEQQTQINTLHAAISRIPPPTPPPKDPPLDAGPRFTWSDNIKPGLAESSRMRSSRPPSTSSTPRP